MTYRFNRLHALFAAEMLGARISADPDERLIPAIEAAMATYAVLVVREQFIDDAEQVSFSRRFGPLELPPHMGLAGTFPSRIGYGLYDVSNLDHEGNLLPAGHMRLASNKANEEFHTDSSFNALATKWSILSARVLPPVGGDTEFVDTRAVWDELPEAIKARARDAVADHWFWKTRGRAGYTVITDDMRRAMPPVRHPVVRTIPESGRTALYVGEHATHIVDWPREEGERFLAELNAFATQPRYVYRHVWAPGDLVIWDNRCTLHRALPFEQHVHARDLRRSTINESGPEISSTDALGVPRPV